MTTSAFTSKGLRLVQAIGRALRWLMMRAYALALIALVGYACYRAFRYLTVTLILPATPPPQITQLPSRLDQRTLESDRKAWAGLETVEHARSPLAHYHRLDAWIQPDRANNCTTSGCHPSLPHAENKANRAFLNMHATSLQCGVCHFATDELRPRLTWYDVTTGQACSPPAVLEAQKLLLNQRDQATPPSDEQAERLALIDVLRRAGHAAQDGRALLTLADHVALGAPGDWREPAFLDAALSALPHYFRGEYGAKLAVVDAATGRPMLAFPDSADAVHNYLRHAPSMSDEARKKSVDAIHARRATALPVCRDCHQKEGRIDFKGLGYSDARAADLTTSVVARMIEKIASGEAFYMPTFMQPDTIPPPSPPPSPPAEAPHP